MRCVLAQHFTIKKALSWRSAIEERPPYQRESAVWSLDKQQLFIDSILNGYDVPKIYLHDLRGEHPTKVYSIIDGKQRLTTLWRFLTDEFALAADFRIEPRNLPPEMPPEATPPTGGQRLSDFDPFWKELFEQTFLSVVLVRFADEQDIEELFSRLNNGEPLNAAEKRNAMGGDMVRLVREVAGRPFFQRHLPFSNGRHQHFDLAARILAVEAAARADPPTLPDLRSAALDAFVKANRHVSSAERDALLASIDGRLSTLQAIFEPGDPLLHAPAHALLIYLAADGPQDAAGTGKERAFLAWFAAARTAALDLPEEARDAALVEFSELSQHGTNERRNIERRLAILRAARERWEREEAPVRAPHVHSNA